MKAAWKLLSLPLRQMPLAGWLLLAMYAGTLAGQMLMPNVAWLAVAGLVAWFWHILAGTALRSAVRGDARMLPHFHRRLLQAGLVDLALSVVVPTLLGLLTVPVVATHLALALSGLLLISTIGLATGTGIRALMLAWLGLIAAGWFPHFIGQLVQAARQSALTPIAFTLLSALLLLLALRPLLKLDDREITESPLGTALGGSPARFASRVAARPRTRWARLLSGIYSGHAETNLRQALQRFERKPSERHRIALVRAVLLPHDSPRSVLLQLLIVAVFVTLYFYATHAATRWDATYVGAYAVFIGTSRFNTVGRGLVRMRANMAELYLTLAPVTRMDFQATLVDTMAWLVGVCVFYCLAMGLMVVVLLHAHQPAHLLLAVMISGVSASLFAFASYLVGPESTSGQMLMRLVMAAFYVGLYALAYWLIGRFGLGLGALLAVMFTLPFGIGALRSARREYLRRAPRFDAPL